MDDRVMESCIQWISPLSLFLRLQSDRCWGMPGESQIDRERIFAQFFDQSILNPRSKGRQLDKYKHG